MAKPALLVYIVNMVSTVISIVAVLIITWGAIIIFIDLIKLEIRRFKGLKPI